MNLVLRSSCILSAGAVLCSLASAGGPAVAVELTPKAHRTWDIRLPAERYVDVGSGFAVPHAGGGRFSAVAEGKRLRVDLDGDGETEALVEGEEGFLTLVGKSPEGHEFEYSVRLVQRRGQPWQYTCGGTMVGRIGDTQIELIDQNLNGSFADVGEDAMVVGRDGAASFLSSVVSIGGELYTLEVGRDGASLSYSPYEGESGTLDLAGGFEGKAKLQAAVVKSLDGRHSFSLAKARAGLRVPAGDYRLDSGELVLGDARATIRAGRGRTITVSAGATEKVQWGGPVTAEFAFQREGDKLAFTPWDIWFHGRLGEEYVNFLPLGKSPEFIVADRVSGEVLVNARFPGNCWGFGFAPVAVSVPGNAEISISMKADNWAFGPVEGRPREVENLSERPVGTEKPVTGS